MLTQYFEYIAKDWIYIHNRIADILQNEGYIRIPCIITLPNHFLLQMIESLPPGVLNSF